jgi:hypothetical protein
LSETLRRIAGELIPDLARIEPHAPALEPACG